MIEYYNKVKEGFEYCKANLEGDISYDQFMSCQQLCNNFRKLCVFYLSKLDKGNYEYAKDVWQGYLNILLSMVQSWQSQWDKSIEEQEAEDAKKKDIWMQMMVADEFQKYKEKNIRKKQVVIKGLTTYNTQKKNKNKKKKNE